MSAKRLIPNAPSTRPRSLISRWGTTGKGTKAS